MNTHGTEKKDITDGLVKFLKYVGSDLEGSGGNFQDEYVEQLQTAVRQVKASREMEERFMLLEELLMDEREAGRAEGLAEAVLDLLQELSGEIPESLKQQIQVEKDSDVLKRYLKTASSVGSVEEFTAKLSY